MENSFQCEILKLSLVKLYIDTITKVFKHHLERNVRMVLKTVIF